MMLSPKFAIFFFIVFIIIFGILITLFLTKVISIENFKSISFAFLLATLNAFFGFFAIKKGFHKSEKVFFKWILGGMVIRLLFILLMVVLVLVFLEINRITFIFSILFFYVIYLITEIVLLNFRSN